MNVDLLNSLNVGALFRGSDYSCVGLKFSRNGDFLAVGFEEGSVYLINSDTAELVLNHRSHKYGLSHFSLLNQDPRGTLAVAVASPTVVEDNSVRLWDLSQNRFARVLRFHETSVSNVSVHPNRDQLLSTSTDGITCMWDVRDEKPVWQFRDTKGSTASFSRSHGSDIFAVSLPSTKSIALFDGRKCQDPIKEIKCESSSARELVFTPDGERLLVGSWELGVISTVNLEKASFESTYLLPATKTRYHLTTSHCSKFAMASNPQTHALDIWDMKTRVKTRSLTGHESESIGAFSPKHAMIATASLPVALWVPLPLAR